MPAYADDEELYDTPITDPAAAPGGVAPVTPMPAALAGAGMGSTRGPALPDLVAPSYAAPDRSRLQSDEAMYAQHAAPIDRKAPGIAPTMGDRIRGGLAAGLLGFAHNPNAVGVGQGIVNSRYDKAAGAQQQQVSADQAKIGQDRQAIDDYNAQFGNELRGFNAQVAGRRESAYAQRQQAQADKYDNAIDANSIEPDPANPGQFRGHTYGAPDKWTPAAAPKGMQPKPQTEPKTYEEMVLRANTEADPQKRAAYRQAVAEIQKAEVRKFSASAPRASEGEMTRSEYNKAWAKSNPGKQMTTQDIAERESSLRERGVTGNGSIAAAKTAKQINDTAEGAYRTEEFGDPKTQQKGYKQSLLDLQQNPDLSDDEKQKQIQALNDRHEQMKQSIGRQHQEDMDLIMPRATTSQPPPPAPTRTVVQQPAAPPAAQRPTAAPQAPQGPQAAQGGPPKGNGRPLDQDTARQFLKAAGGDKNKARQLAQQSGWKF